MNDLVVHGLQEAIQERELFHSSAEEFFQIAGCGIRTAHAFSFQYSSRWRHLILDDKFFLSILLAGSPEF